MIKLKQFAKANGISYKTAHNKFREGEIKGIQLGGKKGGAILVDETQFDPDRKEDKKPDLIELEIADIPTGNSTLENLEACVLISKYLIFNELKQDYPDKQAIISSLRTLLHSTKCMMDFDIEEAQEPEMAGKE